MRKVLYVDREDLMRNAACEAWVKWFDAVCRLRGNARAPRVTRGGVSVRDPNRLRIEITPLTQVWLSLRLTPTSGTAWRWLMDHGFVEPVHAPRVNLAGMDLAEANFAEATLRLAQLSGADLTYATLYQSDLSGADLSGANLTCAYLVGANLEGANLTGATLTGAHLVSARRGDRDDPIPGWTVREGRLARTQEPAL